MIRILFFILLSIIFSCKGKPKETQEKKVNLLYVTAKSGLNYRNSPKGQKVGTFPYNSELKIIEYTGIQDEIEDEGHVIKGTWLGAEFEGGTAYVFSGFLSPVKGEVLSIPYEDSSIEIQPYIYDLYTFETDDKEIVFMSLTDNFPWSQHKDSIVIAPDYLVSTDNAQTHKLDNIYRRNFLEILDISETDSVYVYDYSKNNIVKFKVKDLTIRAFVNPYGTSDPVEQYDYMIGFSFEDYLNDKEWGDIYSNFGYIGKENLFLQERLLTFDWKEIDISNFPKINYSIEMKNYLSSVNDEIVQKAYKWSNDTLNYYVKDFGEMIRHIVVQSSNNDFIVYQSINFSDESLSFAPLGSGIQWTGNLFKGKDPVIFGFFYSSFSCPWIDYLNNKREFSPILCDNRH